MAILSPRSGLVAWGAVPTSCMEQTGAMQGGKVEDGEGGGREGRGGEVREWGCEGGERSGGKGREGIGGEATKGSGGRQASERLREGGKGGRGVRRGEP